MTGPVVQTPYVLGGVHVAPPVWTGWTTEGGGSDPGSPVAYEHQQTTQGAVWVVEHNLGRYPTAWSVFADDVGFVDGYVVQHLDLNTLRVSFDVAATGVMRLL